METLLYVVGLTFVLVTYTGSMVQCAARSSCKYPAISLRVDLWNCFHCNVGLHYPCAAAVLSARVPPSNLVCPPCLPQTASLPSSDPVVMLVDAELPDDNLPSVVLSGKKHLIPMIDGSLFTPPKDKPQLGNVPHPDHNSIVVSPFATRFKKTSAWWVLFSCLNLSLECNKGAKKGCGQFCNLCGKDVNLSTAMSTGPLKHHIQRHHSDVYET